MAGAVDFEATLPGAGEVIAGAYEVDFVIGRGGMGVVVAARHLTLKQRVAIKFLLPSIVENTGAVDRFLREARSAAALQSDHVARVLSVGTLEGGAPYMVLEYLVGTDLRELLKMRGRLTVVEAVDFMLQAGEAIAEAHARGIVHRDLKPSNLFVCHRPDGSSFIKVLDFGLSKSRGADVEPLSDEKTLTESGAILGSPPYMAPEQLQNFRTADARADVWSLGIILYMLIAGHRPFDGTTFPEFCANILFHEPESLTAIDPEVPAELDAAVRRCLVKDVNQRTQSVAELAAAIAPFGSREAERSLEWILRVSENRNIDDPLSSSARFPPSPASSSSPSRSQASKASPQSAHPSSTGATRLSVARSVRGEAEVQSTWTIPTQAPFWKRPALIAAAGVLVGLVGGVGVMLSTARPGSEAQAAAGGVAGSRTTLSGEAGERTTPAGPIATTSTPIEAAGAGSSGGAPDASTPASERLDTAPATASAAAKAPARPASARRPGAAAKGAPPARGAATPADPLEQWK